MKRLLEHAALLLMSFFASVFVGWLAACAYHHFVAVINNVLASA